MVLHPLNLLQISHSPEMGEKDYNQCQWKASLILPYLQLFALTNPKPMQIALYHTRGGVKGGCDKKNLPVVIPEICTQVLGFTATASNYTATRESL